MNRMKEWAIIPGCLVLFLMGISCKKDLKTTEADFDKSPFLNIGTPVENALGIYRSTSGGWITINNSTRGGVLDVLVLAMDSKGRVMAENFAGHSNNEVIYSSLQDEEGNLYVLGGTRSPELRMNPYGMYYPEAYIAKFSTSGSLLWQKGFCDTVNDPSKGYYHDFFFNAHILNGKLYCVGRSLRNLHEDYLGTTDSTFIVTFNKNGDFLEVDYIPGYKKQYVGNAKLVNSIKLSNGDLLIRQTQGTAGKFGEPFFLDTMGLIVCYDAVNKQVKWQSTEIWNSNLSDLYAFGETGDGTLVFLNATYDKITRINKLTGQYLGSQALNLEEGFLHFSPDFAATYRIGEDLFVVGGAVRNLIASSTPPEFVWPLIIQPHHSKPWMMKLDRTGKLVFSRIYDIPDSHLCGLEQDGNGNLVLLGLSKNSPSISKSTFLLKTDRNGNLIDK